MSFLRAAADRFTELPDAEIPQIGLLALDLADPAPVVAVLVGTSALVVLGLFLAPRSWSLVVGVGLLSVVTAATVWACVEAIERSLADGQAVRDRWRDVLRSVDVASIEGRLVAEIEVQREARCVRPPLFDAQQTASDGPRLASVVEGNPATRRCLDSLQRTRESLRTAIAEAAPGTPVPALDLQGLTAQCSELVDQVRASVAREDACSPYRPGLDAPPDSMRLWDIASWLTMAALMEPDPDEGVELAASSIRFMQDVSRGGVGLYVALGAVAATDSPKRYLEHVLTDPDTSPELLAKLDELLPALIASQPTIASTLAGDRLQMSLHVFLPAFKPKGWEPPGGWGSLEPGPWAPHALDERDDRRRAQAAVGLAVTMKVMGDLASLCQQTRWPADCAAGITDYAGSLGQDARAQSKALVTSIVGDTSIDIKEDLADVVEPLTPGMYRNYVTRQAAHRFRLGALHWLTRFRLMAEDEGRCPSVAAARDIDVRDPTTGAQMAIAEMDGAWTVSPGAPLESDEALRFRCPFSPPADE